MNAHDMTNSGAFGLSGLLLADNHRSDAFSSLFDIRTYTWNYRNEMTGFSEKNASGTVIASGTYTYDSLDRRIGVDETSGGTTTQTWIVYNGTSNTPYAQFNGSGTLLERYLAGPSYVPGVTGMVARTSASGVTDWYVTGKLGSVRDIVNTSGSVIDHISYGAFGSIRAETNPSAGSQYKFDGMVYDIILSKYYDNARYYDQALGRFIIEDPSSFHGLDTNLYRFIDNSTLNGIDPLGLSDSMSGGSNTSIIDSNITSYLTSTYKVTKDQAYQQETGDLSRIAYMIKQNENQSIMKWTDDFGKSLFTAPFWQAGGAGFFGSNIEWINKMIDLFKKGKMAREILEKRMRAYFDEQKISYVTYSLKDKYSKMEGSMMILYNAKMNKYLIYYAGTSVSNEKDQFTGAVIEKPISITKTWVGDVGYDPKSGEPVFSPPIEQ